jgi:hypothetical protein
LSGNNNSLLLRFVPAPLAATRNIASTNAKAFEPNYMHRDWMCFQLDQLLFLSLSWGFSMSAQFFQSSHHALLVMKLRAEFNGGQFPSRYDCFAKPQLTRMKMVDSRNGKFEATVTPVRRDLSLRFNKFFIFGNRQLFLAVFH